MYYQINSYFIYERIYINQLIYISKIHVREGFKNSSSID